MSHTLAVTSLPCYAGTHQAASTCSPIDNASAWCCYLPLLFASPVASCLVDASQIQPLVGRAIPFLATAVAESYTPPDTLMRLSCEAVAHQCQGTLLSQQTRKQQRQQQTAHSTHRTCRLTAYVQDATARLLAVVSGMGQV